VTQPGAPLDDVNFSDFLDDYFAECDEHLLGARRLLLGLETTVGRAEIGRSVLEELFRHFHSLKGISGMVEVRAAEALAHRMEDYLRALRAGEAGLTREGLDALFDGMQTLEQVIAARRAEAPIPPIDAIAGRIARIVQEGPASRGGDRGAARPAPARADLAQWQITFTPTRELVERGVRVDSVRQRLSAAGRIVSAMPRVTDDGAIAFDFVFAGPIEEQTAAAWCEDGMTIERVESFSLDLPFGSAARDGDGRDAALGERFDAGGPADEANEPLFPPATSVTPSHVVRVDLTRLDELMRNVGDLVISRARLSDSLARVERRVPGGDWRAIQENAGAIDRQLRTLREGIMRVRLVPVGEIFRRMPFVVRDLARESGKRVRLELQGQATEIDKFLIERMMDPVLHLVRNAVSHGIEPAEERIAAGKRPEGTIVLTASTAGEVVRIEIADDGRGIDAHAVAARAQAAGLAVPAGEPDAAALLALICAPGFSTREESDRASGRGVGMAVVKATVEELSGTLALDNRPGQGTRFIVDLPVTLAITDALIAKVGAETFAVPQSAVREVVEAPGGSLLQVERNEMMPYRGGALPIVRLSRLFGIVESARDRRHLFVIGSGTGALGILVDRIVGQREIVVRAIVDPLARVEGISGATDLGDGHVVLILDPAALARKMRERPDRVYRAGEAV
jgi:two-component system chemotaxis sensor kinase CheA